MSLLEFMSYLSALMVISQTVLVYFFLNENTIFSKIIFIWFLDAQGFKLLETIITF